jgi:hypothetical protein
MIVLMSDDEARQSAAGASVSFGQHLTDVVERALREVPASRRDDVYVVAMWLEPCEEDPRIQTATISWNTRAHLASENAHRPRHVWGILEWSWWGFEGRAVAVVADPETDPIGVELCRSWATEIGLYYPDGSDGATADDGDVFIWEAFWELVVEVVTDLHRSGRIASALGHAVPVFINGLNFYDDTRVELNRAANPSSWHATLDRWAGTESLF